MKEKYYYKTPLGWISIVSSHLHVYEIKYIKKPIEYSFEKPNKLVEKVKENLNIYFLNPNQKFVLPFKFEGTPFQNSIWEILKDIPSGKTKSYNEIAILYGNSKATRAVGKAISQNPIMIFIPCHRVIGSDGSLTGYAGGINKKKWLLEFEGYPIQKSLDL